MVLIVFWACTGTVIIHTTKKVKIPFQSAPVRLQLENSEHHTGEEHKLCCSHAEQQTGLMPCHVTHGYSHRRTFSLEKRRSSNKISVGIISLSVLAFMCSHFKRAFTPAGSLLPSSFPGG